MGNFSEIIKSDTPTLVDFHATWCGPCKALAPTIEELKKKMGGNVRILKIDVDKNQHVSETFKIRSVPTLMLFKKGKTLWRHAGGLDLKSLEEKIKASL